MKNKILCALLSAAAIIPLASCGNNKVSTILDDLCKGFSVEGTISQTAYWLTGSEGERTGEKNENVYTISYDYQNTDIVGVSQNVSYNSNGSVVTMLDDTFIKGNDGCAYFYELGYKNKLEAVAAVDSLGNSINYSYYFDNPFTHINASDFTHKSGSTYELDKTKAFWLSYMLFNQIDNVFYETCKKAEFTIEDGTLKSAKIEPVVIQDYATVGQQNQYYELETVVRIKFSNVGSAKIQVPELRKTKSYHAPLKTAFENLKNNYTLKVTWNSNDYGTDTTTIIHTFYFADSDIYWKVRSSTQDDLTAPDDGPNKINDMILRVDETTKTVTPWGYDDVYEKWTAAAAITNGFSQVIGASVDYFRPVISDVAAEVFDYNETTKIYSATNELLPHLASECFVPPIASTTELNGYTNQFDLTLDSDNNLKEIKIVYSYNNGWDVYEGNYILEFSNIGTTTLPYGITL